METRSWQKDEMICSCGCGRKFKPNYRNGILVSKLTPNCQLKQHIKSNKYKKEVTYQKKGSVFKTPKNRQKSTIDKRLDDAWSKLVKLRAGNKCEVCKNEKSLNSHHIYSRAKRSLRWNVRNGVCLCVWHHIGSGFSAHKTPVEFTEWLMKNRGGEWMKELNYLASNTSHYSEFEKELLLKELKEEILKIKDNETNI